MIIPQRGRYVLMPFTSNSSNTNSNQYVTTTNFSSGDKAISRFPATARFLSNIFPKINATKLLACRKLAHVAFILFIVAILILPILYNAIRQNPSIRHYPLADWGVNVSRNISHYILPYDHTTLIEPRNICEDKLFLLVIVCSGIQNFVARQTIRETWANVTEFNYGMFRKLHRGLEGFYADVSQNRLQYYSSYLHLSKNESNNLVVPDHIPLRILFLLGRSHYESYIGNETLLRIQQESEQYDDIIQENFVDTYNNLTIKSIIALKWMLRHDCHKKAAFFMKSDDDTFVNLPNLLHYLLGGTVPMYYDTLHLYGIKPLKILHDGYYLKSVDNFLVGYLFCGAKPVSNISSKWYMPAYMYPDGSYPNYLSGSAYLMSSDVIMKLYKAAIRTSIIYLEDVYVTGLCANLAHIPRIHNTLFNYAKSQTSCALKGMITQHEMKDDSMYAAYNFVMNMTTYCPLPFGFLHQLYSFRNRTCT